MHTVCSQYLEQEEAFVPPVDLLAKNESESQAAVDEAQRRAQLREEQRIKLRVHSAWHNICGFYVATLKNNQVRVCTTPGTASAVSMYLRFKTQSVFHVCKASSTAARGAASQGFGRDRISGAELGRVRGSCKRSSISRGLGYSV
eukprot:1151201-Pelagomonas_calceolata.AAC.2